MGWRQPQRCRWLGLRIPVLTMIVIAIIGGATRHSDSSGNIGGHKKEGTVRRAGQETQKNPAMHVLCCSFAHFVFSSPLNSSGYGIYSS